MHKSGSILGEKGVKSEMNNSVFLLSRVKTKLRSRMEPMYQDVREKELYMEEKAFRRSLIKPELLGRLSHNQD